MYFYYAKYDIVTTGHFIIAKQGVQMKYLEKHPMIMIIIGVIGISLSSIFVKFSTAPSAVTAAYRILWTVVLMSPMVFGKKDVRKELFSIDKKTALLSALSGLFLAIHFVVWFESLQLTSVASSTTIVCTEVIWVSLGFFLFMKGNLSKKAVLAIAVTIVGSMLIALSDSASGESHLLGDALALFAAIASAIYTLIGRNVRSHVSTSVYTYIVYFVCAVALIITCIAQGYNIFDYDMSAVIVGLLLAVFSTILGHSIFSWCHKFFSPSFVSASKLCEPVVAAIIAAFLFDEIPAIIQIIGSVIIIFGVYYYSKVERQNNK